MKNRLIKVIAPVVFCWCLFLIQGCKDPMIENSNLLTSDDDLNLAKDTLLIKAFSQYEVPLRSSGISTGVLGNINDPNFGKSYAGVYSQFLLTSNNLYFGENPQLDSVVLMVRYSGLYGKFDQPVDVSVYELAQSINDTTIYRTNDAFQVLTPAIGQLNGLKFSTTTITDSVQTNRGKYASHLRIRLNDNFGYKILNADTTAVLSSNAAFLSYFKGFYLTTSSSSTGNGLVYLDMQSAISQIILYYRNGSGSNVVDSLSYRFPFTGVRINHFDNVYSGSPVSTSISTPNTNGEEKVYLQAGVGTKGRLYIKDLDSLPKNIAINKAELILTQNAGDTTYLAPLLLNLYRVDAAGQAVKLDDDGLDGFGGVRTAETINGVAVNRYRFNFKRYFQKLVQGIFPNNGFYVEAIAPTTNSERVVLSNSSTDTNYQMKLVVTYTKM